MRKNRKTSPFHTIVYLLSICVAIAYILSCISGYFDPRDQLWLAFMGLAFPLFLGLQCICTLWWMLRGKWRFFIFEMLLLIGSYSIINAHFGLHFTKNISQKPANALRIISYNVHYFNLFSAQKSNSTIEDISDLIASQKADVVCMQEFFVQKRGKLDARDTLMKRAGFRYSYFQPTMGNDFESVGMVIFSKFPIHKTGDIEFDEKGKSGNRAIYADILVKNRVIRVFNIHLQSLKFQSEDYQFLTQIDDRFSAEVQPAKRIYNLIKTGFHKRAAQVDIMRKNLDNCKLPFIIAGDFNDTPASFAVHQITKDLNNAFAIKGAGWGGTFHGLFPKIQIDYMASSPLFEILNYQILQKNYSDHYPVVVDFK